MRIKTIPLLLICLVQTFWVGTSIADEKIEQINPFTTNDWEMSVRAIGLGFDPTHVASGYRMTATSHANSGFDEFAIRKAKTKIDNGLKEDAARWRSQYSGFEFVVKDFPIFPGRYDFDRKKYILVGIESVHGNKVKKDFHFSHGYTIKFINKAPMFIKLGCRPDDDGDRVLQSYTSAHYISTCFYVDFKSDQEAEKFKTLSGSEQILYSFKCGHIQHAVSRANNKSFAGVLCHVYDLEIHTATKRNIRHWTWNGAAWDDKRMSFDLSAKTSNAMKTTTDPNSQRVFATVSSRYGATQLVMLKKPTKIGGIIYTLIPGDQVEVIAEKELWAKVRLTSKGKTHTGWIDLSVTSLTVR